MAVVKRFQLGPDGQFELVGTEQVAISGLHVMEAGGVRLSEVGAGRGVRIWTDEFQILVRPDGIMVERGDLRISRLRL